MLRLPLRLPSWKNSSTILVRSFTTLSRRAVTLQSPSAVMRKYRSFPRGQLISRGGQSSESFAVIFVGRYGAVRVKSLGKEMENWGNDDLLSANIRGKRQCDVTREE